MKIGFTIGKFAPFHKGHEFLIETALNEVDELIVVVYDTPKFGYDIDTKTKWIQDRFPNVKIVKAYNSPSKYGLDEESVKEYEREIEKIYTNNDYDNKSMLIKVTDEALLQKTGGIIQGMSGSPIIQNGKFIGCVTNVLVNDPKQGYAIFGDLMLKQAKEVDN